jgi:hypothetical protein
MISTILKISKNSKKNDTVIPTKYEDDLKDYNIIYIQRETFNAPLLEKYIL